jgi:hypothetical protein
VRESKVPKASELRSEYIVHFIAPYRDPHLEEVQFEDHLYLVTMTQERAEIIEISLKRMFEAGVIVHGFSVALAEAVRVTPMDLRQRLTYFWEQSKK